MNIIKVKFLDSLLYVMLKLGLLRPYLRVIDRLLGYLGE